MAGRWTSVSTLWTSVGRAGGPRVLAVNADEGEPGTIKDRYVMELRPRLLVQAIGLVATAIDAAEVYVYLREEYGLARERLEAAIAEAGLRAELGELRALLLGRAVAGRA